MVVSFQLCPARLASRVVASVIENSLTGVLPQRTFLPWRAVEDKFAQGERSAEMLFPILVVLLLTYPARDAKQACHSTHHLARGILIRHDLRE